MLDVREYGESQQRVADTENDHKENGKARQCRRASLVVLHGTLIKSNTGALTHRNLYCCHVFRILFGGVSSMLTTSFFRDSVTAS